MEIRLDRAAFMAELTPMQGIVERKSTIPVLSHILLRCVGDRLQLSATDLDVSLTSSVTGEVTREGGIAVQARKFSEIIRALVGDEVLLALEDEKTLRIAAGRSRFKIRGLLPEDFPSLPQVKGDEPLEIPFEGLQRMISKVIFAVSTEESRFQLSGALLHIKEGKIEMVATDGRRLALVENPVDGLPDASEGVLVPRKALQELQRFEGDGAIQFRRGEHHLSFRLGQRELIGRILDGTFPDYDRVIARDNDKRVSLDRKLLIDAIQRVALLTGDRARAIRLRFAPDEVVLSAANPDLGEAVEKLACEYDGPEIEIGMNPDYLVQFLVAAETAKVRLELKDENTQCVGFPIDGADERYLCVVMPMRI